MKLFQVQDKPGMLLSFSYFKIRFCLISCVRPEERKEEKEQHYQRMNNNAYLALKYGGLVIEVRQTSRRLHLRISPPSEVPQSVPISMLFSRHRRIPKGNSKEIAGKNMWSHGEKLILDKTGNILKP